MVKRRTLPRGANPPYHDMRLDFEILAASGLFNKTSTGHVSVKPLQHFSVVGAMFTDQFKLLETDRNTITATLQELDGAGIPIAPLPEFHFYNLLAPVNSDFLVNAIVAPECAQTDVVIASYIWGGQSEDLIIERMPYAQQSIAYNSFDQMYRDFQIYRNNREVSISRAQAFYKDAWSQACESAGARVVMTRGDDNSLDTVNTEHLLRGKFYQAAIGNGERHKSRHYFSGSLGFALSPDAISDYAPVANPGHLLGERIVKLAR